MRRALGVLLFALVPAQALAQSAEAPPPVIVAAPLPDVQQPASVQPAPFRPRVHRATRLAAPWAITAGSGALAVAWVASVIGFFAGITCQDARYQGGYLGGTTTTCSSPSGWLLVPLVGPWVALAGPDASNGGAGYQAALVVDGLTQVSGLAMLIVGLAVRRPLAAWSLLPGAPRSSAGLSLTVRF